MTRLYLVLSGGLSGEERRSTSEKHSALEALFEALFFPADCALCSGRGKLSCFLSSARFCESESSVQPVTVELQ